MVPKFAVTTENNLGGDHFAYVRGGDWYVKLFCSCESFMAEVKVTKPNKKYFRNCRCDVCCSGIIHWEIIRKDEADGKVL